MLRLLRNVLSGRGGPVQYSLRRNGYLSSICRKRHVMTLLTFQVLEGMERGRVLTDLVPPLTIGREEDNAIQLNDERVSRFHAKVQEDNGRIILTDLESTNGSRVNGHPVQMHVLNVGDQIAIGRCLLLYGSADEIEAQIQSRREQMLAESPGGTVTFESDSRDFFFDGGDDPDEELPRLFPDGAPDLPTELRPFQAAMLSDVLAHVHDRLRSVILAGRSTDPSDELQPPMLLDWEAWQRMLNVEMDLSRWIRSLSNPSEE